MKLSTWIDKNGGNAATGKILNVGRNRVYSWRAGVALPNPQMMYRIVKTTRGRVSYAEIIGEWVKPRPAKKRPTKRKVARRKAIDLGF